MQVRIVRKEYQAGVRCKSNLQTTHFLCQGSKVIYRFHNKCEKSSQCQGLVHNNKQENRVTGKPEQGLISESRFNEKSDLIWGNSGF